MAVMDNLNYTYSAGVAPGMIEYYRKTMLENPYPELPHARDSQKIPLPPHNGKRVTFFRMTPFDAVTTPLSEGVTPTGQTIKQTKFTAMVKPYGRHVEVTDELDWYHLNIDHQRIARELRDQALLSVDTIARDPLHTGLNVQYVDAEGSPSNRAAITTADKLTYEEVKKAVRTLKRNNCKPFSDGFYHAIVHPDTVYDLQSDTMWVDVAKYQDKQKVEKGELGCIHKVKFYESTNAKTFTAKTYLFGTTASLTVTAYDATARTLTFSDTSVTNDIARELTGQMIYINDKTSDYVACIESIDVDNKKITLRYAPSGLTFVSGSTVKPYGGGASGATVYSTIIYGQDAFGTVSFGGSGENIEIIMNPPGSSGALDPLKQRGTIAWKVKGFCSVILQDAFIVRVEHGATA